MSSIVIVDYGMGNLRSVQKAFETFGHHAQISSDADRIAGADKVVLPGVGAFRDAIARLREANLAGRAFHRRLSGDFRTVGVAAGKHAGGVDSQMANVGSGLPASSGRIQQPE